MAMFNHAADLHAFFVANSPADLDHHLEDLRAHLGSARARASAIARARAAGPEHSLAWQFSDHPAPFGLLPLPVLDRVCQYLDDPLDLAAVASTCGEWRRRLALIPWVVARVGDRRAAHEVSVRMEREHARDVRVHHSATAIVHSAHVCAALASPSVVGSQPPRNCSMCAFFARGSTAVGHGHHRHSMV